MVVTSRLSLHATEIGEIPSVSYFNINQMAFIPLFDRPPSQMGNCFHKNRKSTNKSINKIPWYLYTVYPVVHKGEVGLQTDQLFVQVSSLLGHESMCKQH